MIGGGDTIIIIIILSEIKKMCFILPRKLLQGNFRKLLH